MNSSPCRVVSVQIGSVALLGPKSVPSGFVKHVVAGKIMASVTGLAGDAQADRRLHGGFDKAVYGYSEAAYDIWRTILPRHAHRFRPGCMGENLTVAGLDEGSVCIGDRVRIGDALFQVTEPRQPCFKLALYFDDPSLPRAMNRSGLCGWYYRVLEPGYVAMNDAVVLIDRPNTDWPVRRFFEIIVARAGGRDLLAEMVAIEGLSEAWKLKALQGLARLNGDPSTR
jgi:MOSC domain-containing protein YiiM